MEGGLISSGTDAFYTEIDRVVAMALVRVCVCAAVRAVVLY